MNNETAPPGAHLKLLGIEIARKTDVLALAAFMLSVGGVIAQAYIFLSGPVVVLFGPEQVLIMRHEYAGGRPYLRLAARMAYVNKGRNGKDVVMQETIGYKLGDKFYEQRGQDYTASSAEQDKLSMNRKGDALPVALDSGGADAHETWFAPRTTHKPGMQPYHNFLPWEAFMSELEKQKELEFELSFRSYGGGKDKVTCRVVVDDALRANLAKKGWSAPACVDGAS